MHYMSKEKMGKGEAEISNVVIQDIESKKHATSSLWETEKQQLAMY